MVDQLYICKTNLTFVKDARYSQVALRGAQSYKKEWLMKTFSEILKFISKEHDNSMVSLFSDLRIWIQMNRPKPTINPNSYQGQKHGSQV